MLLKILSTTYSNNSLNLNPFQPIQSYSYKHIFYQANDIYCTDTSPNYYRLLIRVALNQHAGKYSFAEQYQWYAVIYGSNRK